MCAHLQVSVDEALIRQVSAKCLGDAEAANKRLAFCQSRKKVRRACSA
jgi:hypothetical protein